MRFDGQIRPLPQTSVGLSVEGELFGVLHDENRLSVAVHDVAASVVDVLIAVEDRRFFSHHGVDLRAIARAAYVNLRTWRIAQGGSTITQQLARAAVLRRWDRTLRRKFAEAIIALLIERRLSKLQIIETYLNAAYFGHGVYGIDLAARTLCGKTPATLSHADAAYLVGLLRGPARYCRCCNPDRAAHRQAVVQRVVGSSQATAPAARVHRRPLWSDHCPATAGYPLNFISTWMKRNLAARYPTDRLHVHTTFDGKCQLVLERAIASIRESGYQGRLACVLQDAQTGETRAVAGGSDFRTQPFNVATNGNLQPGSLLKPFVLIAALDSGMSIDQKYISRPLEIRGDKGVTWSVRNAGDRYRGLMSVCDALVLSDNTVFVQLMLDVGLDRFSSLLASVGIHRNITPAVALGAMNPGISPLQVCQAYSLFSAKGRYLDAAPVSRVTSEDGAELWRETPQHSQVCRPEHAEVVREVLRRVSTEGTGVLPLPRPRLASKTGTSTSGGWYISLDDTYRLLTWTESDFVPAQYLWYPEKGVSAKNLANRIWSLLEKRDLGFADTFSVFAGVDDMPVRDLLWIEDELART